MGSSFGAGGGIRRTFRLEAESDAGRLAQGLGLGLDVLYREMNTLTGKEKVKVLLAQALFGKPISSCWTNRPTILISWPSLA
jgi:ATPase subunit of ABC transporter with duplicated ATPase domains